MRDDEARPGRDEQAPPRARRRLGLKYGAVPVSARPLPTGDGRS